MKIHIYEDEQQVGTIDIGAETYEYQGQLNGIQRVLQRMEDGEITMTNPVQSGGGYDESGEPPGIEQTRRRGAALAQWLPQVLEEKGRGKVDVYADPIGYERDY